MLRSRKETICREPNVGLTARAENRARPCTLGQEMCEVRTAHPGRLSRLHHGGSGVRTTDGSPEVQHTALSGGFAEGEPEPRQVPLSLREERNEEMGLLCSQMADKGATQDGSSSEPVGKGADSTVHRAVPPMSRWNHSTREQNVRPDAQLRRRTRRHVGGLRHPAGYSRNQDGIGRIGLGDESVDAATLDDRIHGRPIRERVRCALLPHPQRNVLTQPHGGSEKCPTT